MDDYDEQRQYDLGPPEKEPGHYNAIAHPFFN